MHMHEMEASWMKDSKSSLKMVSLFHMLWKKPNPPQDTEQKAEETSASSFYAYEACHISV